MKMPSVGTVAAQEAEEGLSVGGVITLHSKSRFTWPVGYILTPVRS